ncbi:hypothetical protein POI8812_02834 [Pontivivens insulae]|uniref:Uncharacterized protein n=1 Tax=Pontivivens insulae TaxID=1639689 RepID=A0A2R8AEK7_9RHOB|nr:hypothetical protein POI8812_02834 [Pontivivens insulae]
MLAADGELSSQCVGVRNLEPVGGKETFAARAFLSYPWPKADVTRIIQVSSQAVECVCCNSSQKQN